MHEYSITESIIKIVDNEVKKGENLKVKKISLVIGELSSIIDDSIQMYFDLLSEDTSCQGAELQFIRVKAQLECKECNKVFERNKSDFNCPYCNGLGRFTERGREFYIESIEVE